MEDEALTSENKQPIIDILDGLRGRAASDELLQIFIVVEDGSGEFESLWSGTTDRFAIAGFALGAIMSRMGFVRPPDPEG